jgi:hypothetical protein
LDKIERIKDYIKEFEEYKDDKETLKYLTRHKYYDITSTLIINFLYINKVSTLNIVYCRHQIDFMTKKILYICIYKYFLNFKKFNI